MLAAMAPPSLFLVVIVGLLAGMLARRLVGRRGSPFGALVAGLSGAVLGVSVAALLGLPIESLAAIAAAALAGAAALLAAMGLVQRR